MASLCWSVDVLEAVLVKIAFCLDCSLTARGCSCDSLTVERICYVPCCEDSWNLGAWCSSLSEDIAYFVSIDPWGKELRVRVMTDSEEEAIYWEVYTLLIGFSLALDQMSTLDTVLTV